MFANKRVRIVASNDYPETIGFFGFVDSYGLLSEGKGFYSGGINLDKLGYYFFPFVKVGSISGENVILGNE